MSADRMKGIFPRSLRERAGVRGAVATALITMTTGCSLAPKYERPQVATPDTWREDAAASTAPAPEDQWWQLFNDPALDSLVERALAANQDLAIAAARVEEARAFARVERAGQLPQVGVSAGVSRSRITQKGSFPLPPTAKLVNERGNISASVSYELDLFGKLRNATRAARAELLAVEFNRDAVRLALVSDVASAYIDLRTLDRQIEIARQTEGTRSEGVGLLQTRFEGGLISELEVEQGKAELAGATATRLEFERFMHETEHRLSFLLGGGPIQIERGQDLDALTVPAAPGGLPSSLLERRPDVRRAEQSLIAANARIGAARAALFPSISLTGYAGFDSTDLSNLFVPEARIWQAAAALLQPIFYGGRNRALVRVANARQQEAALSYQQSVYGAFRDVEDALVARRIETERRGALEEQVRALGHSYELARTRYENGDLQFLTVLDAQRGHFGAQLALADGRRSELQAVVDLYRALGGGWGEGEAAAAHSPE
jgi:multidrug efflux system outer membrane protein